MCAFTFHIVCVCTIYCIHCCSRRSRICTGVVGLRKKADGGISASSGDDASGGDDGNMAFVPKVRQLNDLRGGGSAGLDAATKSGLDSRCLLRRMVVEEGGGITVAAVTAVSKLEASTDGDLDEGTTSSLSPSESSARGCLASRRASFSLLRCERHEKLRAFLW